MNCFGQKKALVLFLMRKQFTETIENLFSQDENLVLLLCDIGVYGFRDSFKNYPDRIYKTLIKIRYNDGQEIIYDDDFEFILRV